MSRFGNDAVEPFDGVANKPNDVYQFFDNFYILKFIQPEKLKVCSVISS